MADTGSRFGSFLSKLNFPADLPGDISVINPYREPEVRKAVKSFCSKYYTQNKTRVLILGINPGRFGAGITGIPFTDPVALETICGIVNPFQKKQELSSRFIYLVIDAFGGPEKFYDRFLLSAVCPLGFLQGHKNYNYYDSPSLFKASQGFIKDSLRHHARWDVTPATVVSLGKRNASCLEAFNRELKLFENIITLEHPRYIMQYKLKSMNKYVDEYCKLLNQLAP